VDGHALCGIPRSELCAGAAPTAVLLAFRQVGIPFFIFAAINMYAFHHMFGWIGVLCPLLFMVGGIIEGAHGITCRLWASVLLLLCAVAPAVYARLQLLCESHNSPRAWWPAGVVAETIFDQRWHGFAVVLLNAGLIAEFILFQRVTA
jgi:hypothetical protein